MLAATAPVLIALAGYDYDPSEAAIPWLGLRAAGFRVAFATPNGEPAVADPLMLSGEALDPWGWLPALRRFKLLGLALRANHRARAAHAQMLLDPAFQRPCPYAELQASDYLGVLLPGGHRARGVCEYLESRALQDFVGASFGADLPLAAICHGVVLAARSRVPGSQRSVLYGRRSTGLTWALERSAWRLTRYYGRPWDPHYYRTYREAPGEPAGYRSVEAEVRRALARPEDFLDVPEAIADGWRKRSGLFRDSPSDHRPAWLVQDGNYLSARWPGDLHAFTQRFIEMLRQRAQRQRTAAMPAP